MVQFPDALFCMAPAEGLHVKPLSALAMAGSRAAIAPPPPQQMSRINTSRTRKRHGTGHQLYWQYPLSLCAKPPPPPFWHCVTLPTSVVGSTLQSSLSWGMTECEAQPEGRQGAEEAFVSRGTTVGLSLPQNLFPRWFGTSKRKPFPPQTPNQCVHPEIRTGTLTASLIAIPSPSPSSASTPPGPTELV